MKLLYIAGPFNGNEHDTLLDRLHNVRAAENVACQLTRLYPGKVHPVVPHSLGRVLFDVQREADAREGTLLLMRRCDGVLMLQGCPWPNGAKTEYEDAIARGQPVFLSLGDPRLSAWLETT